MQKNTRIDELFVGNALGAFSRALSDRIDEAVKKATGLSCSACYAIVQIGSEPNLPIERLRRMLNLQHSSVVRLVDRLEDNHIAARNRGATSDMREVSVSLTNKGEEYFTRILESRRGVLDKMLAGISETEQEMLMNLLVKLMPNIVHPGDDQHVVCRLCDLEICEQELCPVNLAFPEHYELPEKPFRRKPEYSSL